MNNQKLLNIKRNNYRKILMLSFDHIIHQLLDLSSYNYFSIEESDQKIDSFKNIDVKLSSHVYG